MNQLVVWINGAMTAVFTLLLWPLRGLDPIWGLTAISLLSGILILWIFGKTSRQKEIRTVKNRLRGNLLGVRLYQHDVAVVMRLQGRILRDTLTYLRHSMTPMLFLIPPMLLILIQLNLFFSLRPLRPGEEALVTAQVTGVRLYDDRVSLEAPAGVTVETPGVRIPSTGEVSWRIRAGQPGRYPLLLDAGGDIVHKELAAEGDWGPVSGVRTKDLLDLIFYSGEPAVESGNKIEAVEVRYRPLEISIWDIPIHWLLYFFVVSTVAAFAFRRVMGVEL